jgi:hypothetical protein
MIRWVEREAGGAVRVSFVGALIARGITMGCVVAVPVPIPVEGINPEG